MLNFTFKYDSKTGKEWIETSLAGKPLLMTPQLNKGTAFTEQERHEFELLGKLPARVESLESQVKRAYQQFQSYNVKLNKNIYLSSLHDTNHVLFYHLVSEHLAEMLPVIYTPIVGTAVKEYSREYRHPRGLYITYEERDMIEEILDNRSNPEVDLIVVTDGEGILGIGDQGVGGMDIPVAKLMVYTLCGGINPGRTLPILLDVGTNNQALLDDPMYLGWRHERVRGAEYDEFIYKFVTAVNKKFPNIFLHWEDFSRDNARRNLERFRHEICTFNDDMQGTGVVTLAAILAAINATNSTFHDQRIIIFGAGTAGTGIADQIYAAMLRSGLTENEARERFWLLDRPGLLIDDLAELTDSQRPYARARKEVSPWQVANPKQIELLEVVKQVKPTIMIGSSAVAGAFTQAVIKAMAKGVKRPIVLPLSNPPERCEATPEDIITWTQGKALIATGTLFDAVDYHAHNITIAQCNNALVFPGIGLGIIAVNAKHVSDEMLWAACQTLSKVAPISNDPKAPLLPSLDDARDVALEIAFAVAKQAQEQGVAEKISDKALRAAIAKQVWKPHYVPYVRK